MKPVQRYSPSNPHRQLPRSPKAKKIPPPIGRRAYTHVYEVPIVKGKVDLAEVSQRESHLNWTPSMKKQPLLAVNLLTLHNECQRQERTDWPISEIVMIQEYTHSAGSLIITIKQPASPARLGKKNRAFIYGEIAPCQPT